MVSKLHEEEDEKTTGRNKDMSACFVDEDVQALVALEEFGKDFTDSRLEELEGLAQMRTFEVVIISETDGHRLYNSFFVYLVKMTA